ncbi:MAG: ABC transporter ATP-binding protein/permease [Spirochaetia bacterium]|nr:ABC transporter ATP-binding protein/permease [Spirochaetia bacterium]
MKSFLEKLRARLVDAQKSFGNVPGTIRLVWQADRRSTAILGSITIVSALLPVAQAYIAKLIIDSVLAAIENHLTVDAAAQIIWPYLGIEFVLFALGSFLSLLRRLAEQVLEQRAGHRITEEIIQKALRLPLPYFEDSQFYDGMQKARREAEYKALAIINGVFSFAQNLMTLFSFLFILVAMNPWIAIVLFSATIPSFAVQTRYSKLKFRLQSWRAPEARMMNYLEQVLTLDSTVKEVKLFRLGDELLARFKGLFNKIFNEDMQLARKRLGLSFVWGLLSTISFYACYAWIIYLAVLRRITLGDMTLYLAAVRQAQGSFQGLLDNVSRLYENGLFMDNLFSFLGIPEANVNNLSQIQEGVPERAGIRLEGVYFKYANSDNWAVEDVSLEIQPGEKFALVGENGSGKTTLIKLLAGLYSPVRGTVSLNDRNISEMDPAEVYRWIGVIFQDYVRYQLTLGENVGFGSIENWQEDTRIRQALQNAGADDLTTLLSQGLASTLGHQFKGGRELSGGQWQKIALARAFMRDAPILILDEPTSALDAEREYEIFKRFKALTEGKTAILISHRFSTVRMADRIGVMEKGRLIELGTHEELVRLGGRYANLFEMQAEGYR